MADEKLQFDYFPLYEFYQVALPKELKEFGMDPANYLSLSLENMLKTLNFEATNFATAMLLSEYQACIPVSSCSSFLGSKNSTSFADSRMLFKTFSRLK